MSGGGEVWKFFELMSEGPSSYGSFNKDPVSKANSSHSLIHSMNSLCICIKCLSSELRTTLLGSEKCNEKKKIKISTFMKFIF